MKVTVNVKSGTVDVPDEELINKTALEAEAYINRLAKAWLESNAEIELDFDSSMAAYATAALSTQNTGSIFSSKMD